MCHTTWEVDALVEMLRDKPAVKGKLQGHQTRIWIYDVCTDCDVSETWLSQRHSPFARMPPADLTAFKTYMAAFGKLAVDSQDILIVLTAGSKAVVDEMSKLAADLGLKWISPLCLVTSEDDVVARRAMGLARALRELRSPDQSTKAPPKKKARCAPPTLDEQEALCVREDVYFLAKDTPKFKERERQVFRTEGLLSTLCPVMHIRLRPVDEIRPLVPIATKQLCLARPQGQVVESALGLQPSALAAKPLVVEEPPAALEADIDNCVPLYWRMRHEAVFREFGWAFNARYWIVMNGGRFSASG